MNIENEKIEYNGMRIEALVKGQVLDETVDELMDIHSLVYKGSANLEKENLKLHEEDIRYNDSEIFVLRNAENKIQGYILLFPQKYAHDKYSKNFDEQLKDTPNTFYIDTVEMSPTESSNPLYFVRLLEAAARALKSSGKIYLSMHIKSSISDKFIDILKKKVSPNIKKVRKVNGNWYGKPEEFDYVEIEL